MPTQARSGIGISNDCISGDFTPNVIVSIAGTPLSSGAVIMSSLSVTLNRNDEPDTASFIVNRDAGVTPTAGQAVGIALGDATNYLLAGQIMQVERVRLSRKVSDSPEFRVTCSDWTPLFNRRLITQNFSGLSATTIAQLIVSDYTTGFFDYAIEAGLPTINEFICVNETPMSALRRLATILGGGCLVDPNRIVHLWNAGGNSSAYAPSAPATLTNSLGTLKSFAPEYDFSQIRTKVIVEGRAARLRETIPVGADLATYGVPIDHDGQWYFNPDTDAEANFARIGPLLVSYDDVHNVVGPPFAFVTTTPATAGDTGVTFNGASGAFPTPGSNGEIWVYEPGGSYFVALGTASAGADDQLVFVPASGYGSLKVDLPVGTPLYRTGHLSGVTILSASGDVETEIKEGEAVIVRAEVEDSSAQTAIAAIEGGDGIHEHIAADADLTYLGCVERAEAELDTFGAALVRATWVTHDMQALPGAQQVINMSSPDVLSTTLTIDSVTIDFPVDNTAIAASPTSTCSSNRFPRRVCRGSTVKLETILDAIKG